MLFWLTSAASGPPGVSPNYSIILFTCTPSCDWRVFVSSRQQMALLAHSDSWCCFSRAGPPLGYNDPGPGLARYCEACRHCPDRPGLLSAAPGWVSASESRDNTREMRCGDTRPAHRGSLTRLQWGSGIKNKLKSRSHLLSVSQSGGNVEARARCDCVTCGMSGQNDRTELFWIYGDGDNLVSLHAPAPAMHWTRGLTMMQKELPRWNLFIEFLEII